MSARKESKLGSSWSSVKTKLAAMDHVELVALLRDLYALSKANQSFLRARFSLGTDVLESYKKRIRVALFPDWNKPVRVAEAKKAIMEYRKAIGRPDDLLELYLFWCETASEFSMEFGYADEGYFDALLRQYEAAIKMLDVVDGTIRREAIERLGRVCHRTEVGYGVQDEMNWLLERAV